MKSGGSVAHTSGIINALKKIIDLDILSNEIFVGENIKIQLIPPNRLPLIPTYIKELLYNLKIIKYINGKEFHYNAIYQRFSGGSFSGAFLAKKNNVPFILEYNSSDVWRLKNWKNKSKRFWSILKRAYQILLYIPLNNFIESYNFKNAKLIVVVSDVMKNNLIDQGVPSDKILSNPNGVDPDKYKPDIDGSSITVKYNLTNKTVIGFIGTFGQWHGIMEMCEAIKCFYLKNIENQNNTVFLLIGDGVLLNEAKEYFTAFSFQDNIIFTGSVPQEEGAKYLSACDILLSPHIPNPDGTMFFGSPTKLFEYMAMGKAIIASDLGQIGQLLNHELTAYMVTPGDSEELAVAINTLINNINFRLKLGENARKEVIEKYTWDINVDKVLNHQNVQERQNLDHHDE